MRISFQSSTLSRPFHLPQYSNLQRWIALLCKILSWKLFGLWKFAGWTGFRKMYSHKLTFLMSFFDMKIIWISPYDWKMGKNIQEMEKLTWWNGKKRFLIRPRREKYNSPAFLAINSLRWWQRFSSSRLVCISLCISKISLFFSPPNQRTFLTLNLKWLYLWVSKSHTQTKSWPGSLLFSAFFSIFFLLSRNSSGAECRFYKKRCCRSLRKLCLLCFNKAEWAS